MMDIITTGSSMDNTINLQKFDLEGNLIWRRNYLPEGYEFGGGHSVMQTSDGGYALTGSVYGENNKDVLIIKCQWKFKLVHIWKSKLVQ